MMSTQQPQPVPANQLFAVTLEAQQWNAVLAALADTTFRVAAPLIQTISEQLQGQAPPPNGQSVVDIPQPH